MTDKYYDVYFDPAYLVVDTEGRLENPEALQIIEFEYDDETEEVTACRRVDAKGNVLEDPWKNYSAAWDFTNVGENDFPTISKALGAFEGWLTDHLDWRESWRGDYYNPPEYICAGIEGYVDEPPYRHKHIDRDLIRAMSRKRR